MNIKEMELAVGLKFNALEFATEVVASLGNRGGGKSNGAAVVAESLLGAGVQIIVLDYVGLWFSLRLEPDGKTPSRFQIPVLGGSHGDIGLSASAGMVVGEALADRRSPAVLDISGFSKGDRCRFATDFAESFFRAKKKSPGPVHLLLEESQRFVPQRVQPDQARMLGAFEEMAEVGRNYGIGLHLISQRPQKIAKDVLNLADTVLAYRTNGVLERKAIAEWVQEKGADGRTQVHDELPTLQRGEAIVWSPTRQIYGRYSIFKKSTYDAGATPLHARADVMTSPLDLGALEAAMGKAAEEERANDPRTLRAEIARLKAELARRPNGRAVEKRAVERRVEVPVIPQSLRISVTGAQRAVKVVDARIEKLRSLASECMPFLADAINQLDACLKTKSAPTPASSMMEMPTRTSRSPVVGDHHLSRCARSLLQVLAQRHVANHSQLGALAGYSRNSSGFANALSELRVAGLVTGDRHSLKITPGGRDAAGDVEPLPIGSDLLAYWGRRLGKCEAALLKAVYDNHHISRADLAETSGYSVTSSGFANGISTLRVLGLIHGPNGGDLEIADVFEMAGMERKP